MEPIKPGNETTEWKLTMYAFVVGTVLEVLGVGLSAAYPDAKNGWVHGVLVVSGMLLQILKGLGYYKSRTDVKVAAQGKTALQATLPMLLAAAQEGMKLAAAKPGDAQSPAIPGGAPESEAAKTPQATPSPQ